KGVVSRQFVKPGQTVQAQQPVLSLIPGDGALEVELTVPSRGIGFVREGDVVLMRYEAFPFQKFGHQRGRVARVSRSAVEVPSTENGPPESVYQVVVSLENQTIRVFDKDEALKPGMKLEADVLGEKRKLVEWIF